MDEEVHMCGMMGIVWVSTVWDRGVIQGSMEGQFPIVSVLLLSGTSYCNHVPPFRALVYPFI